MQLSFKKKKNRRYGYDYANEDIQGMINSFFRPERLDDKFYCSHCKKPRTSNKIM